MTPTRSKCLACKTNVMSTLRLLKHVFCYMKLVFSLKWLGLSAGEISRLNTIAHISKNIWIQESRRMEGSTANTVLMRTGPAEIMERLDGQIGKIVPRFVEHASKIKHGSIDLGITVELCPNSLQDETSVHRERLEHALYHLERVGALMNGHRGLDPGVHAGVQTPNLDGYKVTRNKGHLVTRCYNGLGSHGDRNRGLRMMSSCCMEHHLRVI